MADNTEVSKDGADVSVARNWVARDVMDTLADAITAAALVQYAPKSQKEIDEAAETLAAEIEVFKRPENLKPGTKMTEFTPEFLGELILDTESVKTAVDGDTVKVSTDGNDQSPRKQWVSEVYWADLNNLIDEAKRAVEDNMPEGTDFDALYLALYEQKNGFEAEKKDGNIPDKTDLEAMIDNALTAPDGRIIDPEEEIPEGTTIRNGVTVLAPGVPWVFPDQWETYLEALAAAEDAYEDPDVTVNGTAEAETKFGEAKLALRDAISNNRITIDFLRELIVNAENTRSTVDEVNIKIDVDGNNTSPRKQWVTQSYLDELDARIAGAKEAADNSMDEGEELDRLYMDLYLVLYDKESGFNAEIQNGTTPDKTGLETMIGNALTAPDGIIIDPEKEMPEGTFIRTNTDELPLPYYWALPAEWETYLDTLTAVNVARDDPDATVNGINKAETDFRAAKDAFKAAVEDNHVLLDELARLRTEAVDAKAGLNSSVNGDDISPNQQWVSQALMNALNAALAAAEAVTGETPPKELDTAYRTLYKAKDALVSAVPQNGSPTGPSITALETTLVKADAFLKAKKIRKSDEPAGSIPINAPFAATTQWAAYDNARETAAGKLAAFKQSPNDTTKQRVTGATTAFTTANTTFHSGVSLGTNSTDFTPATITFIDSTGQNVNFEDGLFFGAGILQTIDQDELNKPEIDTPAATWNDEDNPNQDEFLIADRRAVAMLYAGIYYSEDDAPDPSPWTPEGSYYMAFMGGQDFRLLISKEKHDFSDNPHPVIDLENNFTKQQFEYSPSTWWWFNDPEDEDYSKARTLNEWIQGVWPGHEGYDDNEGLLVNENPRGYAKLYKDAGLTTMWKGTDSINADTPIHTDSMMVSMMLGSNHDGGNHGETFPYAYSGTTLEVNLPKWAQVQDEFFVPGDEGCPQWERETPELPGNFLTGEWNMKPNLNRMETGRVKFENNTITFHMEYTEEGSYDIEETDNVHGFITGIGPNNKVPYILNNDGTLSANLRGRNDNQPDLLPPEHENCQWRLDETKPNGPFPIGTWVWMNPDENNTYVEMFTFTNEPGKGGSGKERILHWDNDQFGSYDVDEEAGIMSVNWTNH